MRKHSPTKDDFNVRDSYATASVSSAKSTKPAPRITLRLSEDEFAKLKHLSSGMYLSAYIRKWLFGKDASTIVTGKEHSWSDKKSKSRGSVKVVKTEDIQEEVNGHANMHSHDRHHQQELLSDICNDLLL